MDSMNDPILDHVDPEIMNRLATRREAIRRGAATSSMVAAGLALGSVPIAMAVLSRDVFAQTPADILDALRFAFLLENFENELYRAVLGTSTHAPHNTAFAPVRAAVSALPTGAAVVAVIQQIQKHEQQHVDFLRNVAIPLFGGTAVTIRPQDFDFTGGNGSGTGPFLRATAEVDFLLLTAQAVEDTGVRAYKGQAGRMLVSGNTNADIALESALRIHSVEARHASKLRRIRRSRNPGDQTLRYSGYIRGGGAAAAGAGNITNPPAAVVAALNLIYGGGNGPVSYPESNTRHAVFNGTTEVMIDAATLANTEGIGGSAQRRAAAEQAFDEALTKEEVTAIVRDFIIDDPTRGLP